MNYTAEKLKRLSDEELVRITDQRWRRLVLGLLYDRYEKKVFFKALALLKDRQAAQDLTHDIFIRVFTKLDQFKGKSAFSLWIHSISVNTCINYINKRNKLVFKEVTEEIREDTKMDMSILEFKMLKEIKLDQLQALMNKLNRGERLLLSMKYIDGLSIKEMEKILKIGPSAIKMRLKRSREKILVLHQEKNN